MTSASINESGRAGAIAGSKMPFQDIGLVVDIDSGMFFIFLIPTLILYS